MSGSNPEQLWNLIPNGPTPLTGQEQLLAAQTASPSAPMYRYPVNALTDAAVLVASSVIATGSTISRTLQNRFADRYSVLDWLTPGQPDGTTDNTAQIQAAINGAAGVAQLLFPANANFYMVSQLSIPSDSHLVIELGATIQLLPGISHNTALMQLQNPAPNTATEVSSVLIELYGTLDGNVVNQPSAGQVHAGFSNGAPSCSNIFITGNHTGLITNTKSWPFNVSVASDCEVRGITMSNGGNSCEFNGSSSPQTLVSSGTYAAGTGATTLTTAVTHNISPGQTFTFSGFPVTSIFLSFLIGEYVAGAGTGGTTVNFTGPAHIGPTGPITIPPSNVYHVATCKKSYRVGFVDCVVEGIQDLGLVFYGGVVGGYIRGCEVRYASGPFIFSDNSQPGSNVDCEISDCYSHDNIGGGPTVTANNGVPQHRSRVFNNLSCNNYSGGMSIGAADGAEVYGNTLHDNVPNVFFLPDTTSVQCANFSVDGDNLNVWGNTVRDPGGAITTSSLGSTVVSGTYDPSTGNITIVTNHAHTIPIGGEFFLQVVRGVGPIATFNAMRGLQTATSGTSGTTLTYTIAAGLGAVTSFFDGVLSYNVAWPANNGVVSGSYTSSTGAVALTTFTAHGLSVGNGFVLSGMTGTNVGPLDGMQYATAGTSGTTLNFTADAGMPAITITGGNIFPPNFGIWLFHNSFGDAPARANQITNNFIYDTQSPLNLTAPIGGTWGRNGYSGGNSYGNRLSNIADLSVYSPGLGGSTQGPSFDNVFQAVVGNYVAQGSITFGGLGQSAAPPILLEPLGLMVSWNLSSGAGEIDFFCGPGAGLPGGFNFIQVTPLSISSGTYNSGTGAVVLTTNAPHGMLQGSAFVIANAYNGSSGARRLDGVQTATTGTAGTTVNFTAATGLTLYGPGIITGGNVTPSGSSASYGISSGTYNSGTGAVSLIMSTAPGLLPGNTFVVNSITDGDPDVVSINGGQTATSGTTGSTLNFTIATGLSITQTAIGGSVTPAGAAGGVINTNVGVAGSLLANDGDGNTRLGGALVQNFQTASLANAGTVTIPSNTGFMVIQNSSSIAAGTVVLPSPSPFSFPFNVGGNELEVNFQNAVGALTITGTVTNAPTAIAAAGTSISFIQNTPTSWLRRIMT